MCVCDGCVYTTDDVYYYSIRIAHSLSLLSPTHYAHCFTHALTESVIRVTLSHTHTPCDIIHLFGGSQCD